MNTRFKVFASYNILQYLRNFIHVLIFVTVSKCQKNPKFMIIVINAQNSQPNRFIALYKLRKFVILTTMGW